MAESVLFKRLVQQAIDEKLSDRLAHANAANPRLSALFEFAGVLLDGGKRLRSEFCYWGWRVAEDQLPKIQDSTNTREAALRRLAIGAASLELFHSAALVHDDLIDNSDFRRGNPATHRWFEHLHDASKWTGDSAEFGRISALLLGDLLQSWSDEEFDNALAKLDDPAYSEARQEFNQMRTDVTYGQYLDVLAGKIWNTISDSGQLELAQQVMILKSAKYSVEAPLRIGCAFGGGNQDARNQLSDFGLPIGIAFQLRDDLLGVFGNPELTGKPAGDDLREGKRTLLIALTRSRLGESKLKTFDSKFNTPSMSDKIIADLQEIISDSGSIAEVERQIQENALKASKALNRLKLSPELEAGLSDLSLRAMNRSS